MAFHGKRPFEREEIISILHYLNNRKFPMRDTMLFKMQLKLGYRIHEILSMKISSVGKKSITVERKSMKGKKRSRTVPIPKSLEKAIIRYKQELSRRGYTASDPLFPSSTTGRALRVDSWCKAFGRMAKELELNNIGTHSCRKTYARAIYTRCGNDIMETKAALGHSSVATTQQYLSFNIGNKAKQAMIDS